MDVELTADDATRHLDRALRGRTYRFAVRPITIRGARVAIEGARVGVDLDVTFRAGLFRRPRGRIHLTGVPVFDPATRTLAIRDPRLSVASVNLVRTLGSALLQSPIEKLVAERARFPIGPRVDRLRAEIGRQLQRPLGEGVALSGTVDALRLERISTGAGRIQLRFAVDGSLRVRLDIATLLRTEPRAALPASR